MARILPEQMATRRVTADVVGGFAFAAVALAVLGLYGLMAVTVAVRMRETGVRLGPAIRSVIERARRAGVTR